MKGFRRRISNHTISRIMSNIHISFLFLVRDEEVTNIHIPTSLNSDLAPIFLQEDRTIFILINKIFLNIVSLILYKQFFHKIFYTISLTPLISASVLNLVFNFYFIDSYLVDPVPHIIMPPVWTMKVG